MQVQELKKLIKEDNIPKFLIFTGEEYEIQRQYIQQISKVTGKSVYYAEDIAEIWKRLTSGALFDASAIYVLYDDKEILTQEAIYSQLDTILHDNILILTLSSVDKRLKMLKTYESSIVDFKTLNTDVLKRYVQNKIPLNDRNATILMNLCEHNYGRCLLEIDKIHKYIDGITKDEKDVDVNVDEIFEYLLDNGTFYIPPRDALWDFIKAFLQDKYTYAYQLYEELQELGTPTLAILSNLYNMTKQVLQVQTCKTDNVEKTTGLTSWQIRNARECVGKFSDADLAFLMRLIQRVESQIKQGIIEESIAIDYVFTSFY